MCIWVGAPANHILLLISTLCCVAPQLSAIGSGPVPSCLCSAHASANGSSVGSRYVFLGSQHGDSLLLAAPLPAPAAAMADEPPGAPPARKRRRLSPPPAGGCLAGAADDAAGSADAVDAAAAEAADCSALAGELDLQLAPLDALPGYGPLRDMLLAEAGGAVSIDEAGAPAPRCTKRLLLSLAFVWHHGAKATSPAYLPAA